MMVITASGATPPKPLICWPIHAASPSRPTRPLSEVPATITYGDGSVREIALKCRIDTAVEIEYVENGGVLHYVLRNLAKAA
jgi:aconitase A